MFMSFCYCVEEMHVLTCQCAFDVSQILMLILELYCLQVIYCTEDMIKLSVWDAMHIEQPNFEDVKVSILIYYNLYVHPIFLALFKVHQSSYTIFTN